MHPKSRARPRLRYSRRLVSRPMFPSPSVVSSMKGQTAEETQVVGIHFVMDGFSLQTDDVPDVDQTIENAIDENSVLGSLDTFQKRVKIDTAQYKTGLFQVGMQQLHEACL